MDKIDTLTILTLIRTMALNSITSSSKPKNVRYSSGQKYLVYKNTLKLFFQHCEYVALLVKIHAS